MQVINYHEESVKEVLKKEYKKVTSSPSSPCQLFDAIRYGKMGDAGFCKD